MNKLTILVISVLLIFTVGVTNLTLGNYQSNKVLIQLEEDLRRDAENNLRSITPVVRNSLLEGNIRGARVFFENWRKNNIFAGYKIVESGEVIDENMENVDLSRKRYFQINIPIFYSEKGEKWGDVQYFVSLRHLKRISDDLKSSYRTVFFITTLSILILVVSIFFVILASTQRLTHVFGDYLQERPEGKSSVLLKMIWGPMLKMIDDMYLKSIDWKKKSIEAEKLQSRQKIYRQVSHDIRSPLAAINAVANDVEGLNSDSAELLKMAIERMQSIADNLFSKTKRNVVKACLFDELYSISREKEAEIKGRINAEISLQATEESKKVYSNIESQSFKSIVSNLINNSLEALDNKKGLINIDLKLDSQGYVEIALKDNGKGIPKELLEEVGKEGFSFGKEKSKSSGSGLGLSHAIESIKSWGGELSIESEVDQGTLISIRLPAVN